MWFWITTPLEDVFWPLTENHWSGGPNYSMTYKTKTTITGDPLNNQAALYTALLICRLCSEMMAWLGFDCFLSQIRFAAGTPRPIYYNTSSVILKRTLILQSKTTSPGCMRSAELCVFNLAVYSYVGLCDWFIAIELGNTYFTNAAHSRDMNQCWPRSLLAIHLGTIDYNHWVQ